MYAYYATATTAVRSVLHPTATIHTQAMSVAVPTQLMTITGHARATTANKVGHLIAPFAVVKMTTRQSKPKSTSPEMHTHNSNPVSYPQLFDSSLQLTTFPCVLSDDFDPRPYNHTNTHNSATPTQNRIVSPFYFPQHLHGCYRYTKDLLALDSCTPAAHEPVPPPHLSTIVTPLQPAAWADEPQHLPDGQLVDYLRSGMRFGFRIGCNRQSSRLISVKSNMQSALLNSTPVQDFLLKETRAG